MGSPLGPSRVQQRQEAATSVTFKSLSVPDGEVVAASDESMVCVNIQVTSYPEGVLAQLDGAGDKFFIPGYIPVTLHGVGNVNHLTFEKPAGFEAGDPFVVTLAVEV